MAIALDSTASNLGASTVSTIPSVTVGGGTDRLLLVSISVRKSPTAPTISSVTYNNIAMTSAGTEQIATGMRAALYYLIAPPTGSFPVTVTLSAVPLVIELAASAWTGVHQTTPLTGYASATNTSNTPTVTVANATGDYVVDAIVNAGTTTSLAPAGAGTSFGYAAALSGAAQYLAGGATTVMSWTMSNSSLWATCAVALQPSTATAPPVTSTGTVAIAEMRMTPLRAAPAMSLFPAGVENMYLQFEASGLMPKLVMGTIDGTSVIWDDIGTLPSCAPSGAIAFTGMPTPNSPNGSIVVTTRDFIGVYPWPYGVTPATVPYPRFVRSTGSASYFTDLCPAYYPSTWDAGDVQHTLIGVHVIGERLTPGVDGIGISWRWDDNNVWTTVQYLYNSDSYFPVLTENFGLKLTLCVTLYDAVNTNPIAPALRAIIPWVEELDTVAPGSVPEIAATIPEQG